MHPRLGPEPGDEIGVGDQRGQQHLDRDLAAEGVGGTPDVAHAAGRDTFVQAVPAAEYDTLGEHLATVPSVSGGHESGGRCFPSARAGGIARRVALPAVQTAARMSRCNCSAVRSSGSVLRLARHIATVPSTAATMRVASWSACSGSAPWSRSGRPAASPTPGMPGPRRAAPAGSPRWGVPRWRRPGRDSRPGNRCRRRCRATAPGTRRGRRPGRPGAPCAGSGRSSRHCGGPPRRRAAACRRGSSGRWSRAGRARTGPSGGCSWRSGRVG